MGLCPEPTVASPAHWWVVSCDAPWFVLFHCDSIPEPPFLSALVRENTKFRGGKLIHDHS